MQHHATIRKIGPALLGAGLAAVISNASAIPFNFGITYDGSVATLDATSDAISQTSLNPGDTFKLNIKAAGNDYFEVTNSFWNVIGASFQVFGSGVRTGNIMTSVLLDGNLIAQQLQLNVNQMYVHMGMQDFQFAGGMLFDELNVDYTFLSSTSNYTTIQATDDLLFPAQSSFPGGYIGAFYKSPDIAYRDATSDTEQPESVEEPLTLGLLTLAISLLGYFHRKKAASASR